MRHRQQLQRSTNLMNAGFEIIIKLLRATDYQDFIDHSQSTIKRYLQSCKKLFKNLSFFQQILQSAFFKDRNKEALIRNLKHQQQRANVITKNQKTESSIPKKKIRQLIIEMTHIVYECPLIGKDQQQLKLFMRMKFYEFLKQPQQLRQCWLQILRNCPKEQAYYEYIQILIRMQEYKQAQNIVKSRLQLLQKCRQLQTNYISQYYLYEYMIMAAKNKKASPCSQRRLILQRSRQFNVRNRRIYQYLVDETIMLDVTKSKQWIRVYEGATYDKTYFLAARAYLQLALNNPQKMKIYMNKINYIINNASEGGSSFYKYAYFMNEINFRLFKFKIKLEKRLSLINIQKSLNCDRVIGCLYYYHKDYEKALNYLHKVKTNQYNITYVNFLIILCQIALGHRKIAFQQIKKMELKLNQLSYENLLNIAYIYSSLRLRKGLKKVFQKLSKQDHNQPIYRIYWGILRLMNIALLNNPQIQKTIVFKQVYQTVLEFQNNMVYLTQFYPYFNQLYFLIEYSFQNNEFIEGRLFVRRMSEMIQILKTISPQSADKLKKIIQSRQKIDIGLVY